VPVFSGRLGRAVWFVGTWGNLVVAYFVFGFIYAVWSDITSASGVDLLLGLLEAVVVGPFVGLLGLLVSFPTFLMAPVYLALLWHVAQRWGPPVFRLAAIALAPPIVGSLTFVGWSTAGRLDSLFVRSLFAVLLIYGLLTPSPFSNGEGRSGWHLVSRGSSHSRTGLADRDHARSGDSYERSPMRVAHAALGDRRRRQGLAHVGGRRVPVAAAPFIPARHR